MTVMELLRRMRWMRLVALLGLGFACRCSGPAARSVPDGPPAWIELDVAFFVPVLGTWTTKGFSDSLRVELAKFGITVIDHGSSPSPSIAVITLGSWTDRAGFGRSISVELRREGGFMTAGQVRVPDLAPTTLDVAAEYVAFLVARSLRGSSPPRSYPN